MNHRCGAPIKRWKEIGEINFSNIFCVTQDIKILSFQHVINIKVINEIFAQSLFEIQCISYILHHTST